MLMRAEVTEDRLPGAVIRTQDLPSNYFSTSSIPPVPEAIVSDNIEMERTQCGYSTQCLCHVFQASGFQ